jgi:hypothetical protein
MRLVRLGFVCMALVLAALTSGLVTLAYASPPDPSWIRGMYDDADGDDVVGLVTAGVGLVDPAASADLRPDIILITAPTPIDERPIVSPHFRSRQPRAPPTA